MQELKTFDVGRAMLEDYLDTSIYPARLEISAAQLLYDAVTAQQIAPDARLLTFEYDGVLYAFPMTMVLSYNVIQGRIGDHQPWIMTFCNACNTGMVFDSRVDGQVLHFQRRGSYEGLLLIWDEETDSYWQHITGQCLHGASRGKQLRTITTTRQMSAAEVIAGHPQALLMADPLTPQQEKLSRAMERMRANPERVEGGILSQIVQEDSRRPRFELGLGVWDVQSKQSIFFPLVLLHTYDNTYLTEFEGRRLLIYQSPEAIAPAAAYLDTRRAVWEGDILRLDGGAYIQNDTYFSADKQPQLLETPRQLLMRWYGFAMTFPNCTLPQM